MYKNLEIYCDQDSFCYKDQRKLQTVKNQRNLNSSNNKSRSRSPHYKLQRSFNFPTQFRNCQTPNQRQKSPFCFKSPKYTGIIQKTLIQRLQFYGKQTKQKKIQNQTFSKLKWEEFCTEQLQHKPQINQISKNLYEKVKRQRKLSPNILERFQTYQCQRVSRNAKYELLKTYGMNIKNNTPTCRALKRQTSKRFLKQKNFNRQASKSVKKEDKNKTEKLFQTKTTKQFQSKASKNQNGKHPKNIGKIIKTNMQNNVQQNYVHKVNTVHQRYHNQKYSQGQASPNKYRINDHYQQKQRSSNEKHKLLKSDNQKNSTFYDYESLQNLGRNYTTTQTQLNKIMNRNSNQPKERGAKNELSNKKWHKQSPFLYENKGFKTNKTWRVIA